MVKANSGTFRTIFGILYISSLFSPLALYYYQGIANISGILWAFMTPVGYITCSLGIILLIIPKFPRTLHASLPNILMISGIVVITVYIFQPVTLFLSLWYGTTTNYDIDMYSPLLSAPFYLGLLSLAYKAFSVKQKKRPTLEGGEKAFENLKT